MNLSALTDDELATKIRAADADLVNATRWCDELVTERERRAEVAAQACQAACSHLRGFVGLFEGVCPDCGFVGDPL